MAALLLVIGMTSIGEAGKGRGSSSSSYRASGSKPSSTSVRGYTTKRGTYVAPYRRSTRDTTQTNNYTTKGNVNPYTGKSGTRNAAK
jgi:hypothetical protein